MSLSSFKSSWLLQGIYISYSAYLCVAACVCVWAVIVDLRANGISSTVIAGQRTPCAMLKFRSFAFQKGESAACERKAATARMKREWVRERGREKERNSVSGRAKSANRKLLGYGLGVAGRCLRHRMPDNLCLFTHILALNFVLVLAQSMSAMRTAPCPLFPVPCPIPSACSCSCSSFIILVKLSPRSARLWCSVSHCPFARPSVCLLVCLPVCGHAPAAAIL